MFSWFRAFKFSNDNAIGGLDLSQDIENKFFFNFLITLNLQKLYSLENILIIFVIIYLLKQFLLFLLIFLITLVISKSLFFVKIICSKNILK